MEFGQQIIMALSNDGQRMSEYRVNFNLNDGHCHPVLWVADGGIGLCSWCPVAQQLTVKLAKKTNVSHGICSFHHHKMMLEARRGVAIKG